MDKERPWHRLLNPIVVAAFIVHLIVIGALFVTVAREWGPLIPLVLLALISVAWMVVVNRHITGLVHEERMRCAPPPPPREPNSPFRRPPTLTSAPAPETQSWAVDPVPVPPPSRATGWNDGE